MLLLILIAMETSSFEMLVLVIYQVVLDYHRLIKLLAFCYQGEIHQFLFPKHRISFVVSW